MVNFTNCSKLRRSAFRVNDIIKLHKLEAALSSYNKDQRMVTMMSAADIRDIDDWAFAHRIRSRGEAIRRLTHIGMIAEGGLASIKDHAYKFAARARELKRASFELISKPDPDETPLEIKEVITRAYDLELVAEELLAYVMAVEVAVKVPSSATVPIYVSSDLRSAFPDNWSEVVEAARRLIKSAKDKIDRGEVSEE